MKALFPLPLCYLLFLSVNATTIVESTAEAIAVQQKSLTFLAEVVLDNRIALVYLLAEQGSV